ncbi:hypothetical protein [Aquipuribacter nitratireducens]|uniref:Bacteriocin biosynthesis cyclodehydratase domain-containing protein n=1 Tax=Aquipuribacter nitratireducens TaxID=650104 RepID=A0ABW0GLV8_9MICO
MRSDVVVWAPGRTRAVRGTTALQVGSGRRARVVDGLGPADWAVVAGLDRGVDAARLDERGRWLVALLRGCGAVVPAVAARVPDARGPGPEVAVVGGRGLGIVLTAVLAASGAGTAALVDDATVGPDDVLPGGACAGDVGRRAVHAAAEAVHRVAPLARTGCPAVPDLVVVVAERAHDAPASAPLVQQGVTHVPVLLRDDDVLVGPLVVPGRGPCLHCVDLLHRDVDPAWPDAVRGLRARALAGARPVPSAATSAAVAAVVARLSAAVLPRAVTAGAVAPPGAGARVDHDGEVEWERWSAHPACGCVGLPHDEATEGWVGPPGRGDRDGATMAG